jgi:hypothetical protein
MQAQRDAVVGGDGAGQAVNLEGTFENVEGCVLAHARECRAGDQVPAGEVGDSERVAVAVAGEHETAIAVGPPQVVGLQGRERGAAWAL